MALKKSLREVIPFPENFQVELEGKKITVKSDKGQTSRDFTAITNINFIKENNSIILEAETVNRQVNAVFRTVASHIKNLIEGLEKGYEYKLAVVFSHFPMNISVKGNDVEILNFSGGKKSRSAKIMGDTKVEIKGKEIFVRGNVKEHVGQTAANIENAAKVRGKDRRIFQDGIYIVKKGIKSD